jgi:hypothetical protein
VQAAGYDMRLVEDEVAEKEAGNHSSMFLDVAACSSSSSSSSSSKEAPPAATRMRLPRIRATTRHRGRRGNDVDMDDE